jgi:hypothetical protein
MEFGLRFVSQAMARSRRVVGWGCCSMMTFWENCLGAGLIVVVEDDDDNGLVHDGVLFIHTGTVFGDVHIGVVVVVDDEVVVFVRKKKKMKKAYANSY